MNEVYITGGFRTFTGIKDKAYKNISAEDLGAAVLQQLNEKNLKSNIKAELVIAGNCIACNGNIARLSLLKAGLPTEVPGITIDAQCASGLEGIITAYARIKAGLEHSIIAGGMESASTQAKRTWNMKHPNFDSSKEDNSYTAAEFIPGMACDDAMIMGADETCRVNGIGLDEMLPHVLQSHERALKAQKENLLSGITTKAFGLDRDQSIRESMSSTLIKRLPPLRKGGIINAATSCLLQDGAAFVTLCDKQTAAGIKSQEGSLFRMVSSATVAADGKRSPEGIIKAIDEVCRRNGISPDAVDRIDYNEAFACIDVLYARKYQNPSNCFGGALAYGHPFGATGAILLLHLMRALELNKERHGIAAIPAAGGIASAVLIERVE